MSSEQRALVDLLFEKASAISPAERHAFLAAECPDQVVVREVESLLQFARTGSDTLASAVRVFAAGFSGETVYEGRRIGPYLIEREIGRGGMGAVYLAARDDDFRKTVAVKVLPVGMRTESSVRRFRQERQILAELEHPNIARLLDGGTTEDQLPYLAMEYIPGVAITRFVSEQHLSTTQKLILFRQLCDGVQWAHSLLIVHRDIKPSNILVTPEGIPKLLDFGIAKLIAPDTGYGENLPETGTMMALMTPEYASPEQLRGQPATVATDIYALGAVLFELLTGERAHRLSSRDPVDLAREICETEMRAPSTTGAKWLRGDLDNIVLKAMQKEPGRRYNSVEQFSEDLRRYLENLPVIARTDTLGYRSVKFVTRHWMAVGLVIAIALALGGGIVAVLREAHVAEARFAEGRKLAARLFEIHDDLKKLPGSTAPRELVVRSALEYLDRVAPTAGNDRGFAWELAKAYERTGDAQGSPSEPSLGRTRDAIASYQKAIRIEESLLSQRVLDTSQKESVVRSYKTLSLLYRQLREGKNAVRAAGQAVALADGLSKRSAASAFGELAAALQVAGDLDGALTTIPKAVSLQRELASGQRYDSAETDRLAALLLIAARTAQSTARFDEAFRFASETIDIRETRLTKFAEDQPAADPVNSRELVLTYLTAADILGAVDRPSLNDHTRALPYYRKALTLAERLVDADTHNATARLDLAIAAGKTATQLDSTDPRQAIELYQQALDAAQELVPDGPERALIRAAYYGSIALPIAKLGRVDEARQDFRKSLEIQEGALAKNSPNPQSLNDLADAWRQWGNLEFLHGNVSEAAEKMQRALQHAERSVRMAPRNLLSAWVLSRVLEDFARFQTTKGCHGCRREDGLEALKLRQRVVAIWTEFEQVQPATAFIENQKQLALARLGNSPYADGIVRAALAAKASTAGDGRPK